MLDDYVNKLISIFKEHGDPKENSKIYENEYGEKSIKYLSIFYDAYNYGMLKQAVSISGLVPSCRVIYDGNINNLIDNIKSNIQSNEIIYIKNEIDSLKDLEKIKKLFPDKTIVIKWSNEIAFIDDIIDSKYMINYYKSIVSDELSTLEKIAIIYDIVKSHKYKIDKNNTIGITGRSITNLVHNDYMVCAGYVNLLKKVLKELGILSYPLYLDLKNDNETKYHVNLIIKVKDSKYNFDGFYIFDPTFDSPNDLFIKFDKNKVNFSSKEMKGYRKVDALSKYNYFLIAFPLFEKKFKNSFNEELEFNGIKIDKNKLHILLHSNQISTIQNTLRIGDFINLINIVKQNEGYPDEMIPDLIQESLYLSNYGIVDINLINKKIKKNKEETR